MKQKDLAHKEQMGILREIWKTELLPAGWIQEDESKRKRSAWFSDNPPEDARDGDIYLHSLASRQTTAVGEGLKTPALGSSAGEFPELLEDSVKIQINITVRVF